jgi:hypothetical protein
MSFISKCKTLETNEEKKKTLEIEILKNMHHV